MKYLLSFLFIATIQLSHAQLIVNEILFPTDEIELKNIGTSSINLIGTFIQSTGNSMLITDATNLTCGDFNLSAGEKVVVPIPYPMVSASGDFFIFQNGQTPTSYVQWGGVQGFATLAFAEGLWDDPMTFVPAASENENIILLDEAERKNPAGWLVLAESSPCEENDQCEISNTSISSVTCNDNGTSNDPTDDFFTFFLKVQGENLPDMLFLTSSVGELEPAVLFEYQLAGVEITSYSFPSSSNNMFDILLAAENGVCSYSTTFTATPPCSADCNLQSSQAIILGCVDNNTPTDPSDDFIELIVKPFGFNLANEYYVEFSFGNIEGPFINSSPFSVISTQGFYSPGDGDFSVTVLDGEDANCTQTIEVIDQDNCSPLCKLDADSLAVRCDNGGTPYDDSDDFYTVDVQMSTTASTSTEFQLSLDPFLAIPVLLEYGILHSFSSAPGSTNAINNYAMSMIDPAYPDCIGLTLNGFLNEGCLTECEIFPADIALDDPIICLEPEDESIFTFEVINGIDMDTFMLLALNEFDDIVFFTDKLSFDAREFEAGTYQFVLVHFIELSGLELDVDIDRLEGCFALSPYYEVEIMFQEKCSTSSIDTNLELVSIYPNPATNLLCIESANEINATVYNITGKEVMNIEKTRCISIQNIDKGCYFIIIEDIDSKQISRRKFVKI